MEIRLQITLIVIIILFFIYTLFLLRKNALVLRYTLLWLFTACLLLILILFPQSLTFIVHSVGIYSEMNGLFAIGILFILIILMSLTSIVSKMKNQNKVLTQNCALLEKRIRELERKNDEQQHF